MKLLQDEYVILIYRKLLPDEYIILIYHKLLLPDEYIILIYHKLLLPDEYIIHVDNLYSEYIAGDHKRYMVDVARPIRKAFLSRKKLIGALNSSAAVSSDPASQSGQAVSTEPLQTESSEQPLAGGGDSAKISAKGIKRSADGVSRPVSEKRREIILDKAIDVTSEGLRLLRQLHRQVPIGCSHSIS